MALAKLFSARKSRADSPQARKKRSIAQLKDEGVPVFALLPPIIDEAESLRRTEAEVVARAIATMVTAVKGETRDSAIARTVIAQYYAEDDLSPKERAFIEAETLADADYNAFVWRSEAAYVLLWATGFFESLPYPVETAHVPSIGKLMSRLGRHGMLASAKLRPQSHLLDAADLAARYHWAVANARLNGRFPPANLDAGVVSERLYALNWLIGHRNEAWDDVSTEV